MRLNILTEEIREIVRRGHGLSDNFKSCIMDSLSDILGILSISQTWYEDMKEDD